VDTKHTALEIQIEYIAAQLVFTLQIGILKYIFEEELSMNKANIFFIPFLFAACAYYEQDDRGHSGYNSSYPSGHYSSYYSSSYDYNNSLSKKYEPTKVKGCICFDDRHGSINTELYDCDDETWKRTCENRELGKADFDLRSCFKANWADYDQNSEMTLESLPGCKNQSCSPVPVLVNYLVDKDLGEVKSAVIEAYDNPLFIGAPVKQTFITDFDTSKLGRRKGTFIGLNEGDYYIRSYIIDEQQRLPNWYKNTEIKSGMPVGVLGAISAPKKISVPSQKEYIKNKMCPAQQMIDITQLLTDPNTELTTNAKLKIDIKAIDIQKIMDRRLIKIQLLQSEKANETALKEYSVPSEQLLIASRSGRTSFVTPNLETRTYFVFVYIDDNQNNIFDKGELNSFYRINNEIFPVVLKADEIKTLEIEI
jgi:hypothetical protein